MAERSWEGMDRGQHLPDNYNFLELELGMIRRNASFGTDTVKNSCEDAAFRCHQRGLRQAHHRRRPY